MTEPSQYFKGRTVQEQMDEVIGYVDVRSAEVATAAIASDVAQVHQDMLDADADASAAAASAAAAAGTLANAVKKTGEASQSIAGDIAVTGTLSGGVVTGTQVTVPDPVNNTDAATKKYVDDADALKINIADINQYAVGLTGNQTFAGEKISTGTVRGYRGAYSRSSIGSYIKIGEISGNADGNAAISFLCAGRGFFGMFSVNFSFAVATHTATAGTVITTLMSTTGLFKIGIDYDSVNNVYNLLWVPLSNNVNIHLDILHSHIGAGNPLTMTLVTPIGVTTSANLSEATI